MQIEKPFTDAITRKYPEQVVIVLALAEDGIINPITVGWVMLTSHNPPMMAFSIGITRYSLEVIRHAGECVIAFPGENQAEETVYFGTHSGRDVDKLLQSKVKTVPAYTIDCVLLNDAVANFECKVVSEIQTGDHVIFVAEIVKSHINPDEKNRLYTVAKGFKMSGIRIHSS